MIPKKFNNLSLFVDGTGYAGRVAELTPPKLTLKTEEFRGGGMDAPVSLDMGMEGLSADLSLAEWDPGLLKTFGVEGTRITMRGAFKDHAGAVSGVVITLTGKAKEIDQGSWKPGDDAKLKVSVVCTYYKMEVDGATIHEIDVVNMKRIIGGTDQLAEVRKALGI